MLLPLFSTAPAESGGVGDMTLGSCSTRLFFGDEACAESGVAGYALAGRAPPRTGEQREKA